MRTAALSVLPVALFLVVAGERQVMDYGVDPGQPPPQVETEKPSTVSDVTQLPPKPENSFPSSSQNSNSSNSDGAQPLATGDPRTPGPGNAQPPQQPGKNSQIYIVTPNELLEKNLSAESRGKNGKDSSEDKTDNENSKGNKDGNYFGKGIKKIQWRYRFRRSHTRPSNNSHPRSELHHRHQNRTSPHNLQDSRSHHTHKPHPRRPASGGNVPVGKRSVKRHQFERQPGHPHPPEGFPPHPTGPFTYPPENFSRPQGVLVKGPFPGRGREPAGPNSPPPPHPNGPFPTPPEGDHPPNQPRPPPRHQPNPAPPMLSPPGKRSEETDDQTLDDNEKESYTYTYQHNLGDGNIVQETACVKLHSSVLIQANATADPYVSAITVIDFSQSPPAMAISPQQSNICLVKMVDFKSDEIEERLRSIRNSFAWPNKYLEFYGDDKAMAEEDAEDLYHIYPALVMCKDKAMLQLKDRNNSVRPPGRTGIMKVTFVDYDVSIEFPLRQTADKRQSRPHA